jgi:hypothetical protein
VVLELSPAATHARFAENVFCPVKRNVEKLLNDMQRLSSMVMISETLFFPIADVKVCLYLFKSKGQVAF